MALADYRSDLVVCAGRQGRRQVKKCGVDTHGECEEHHPTTGPRAEPPARSWGRAPGQEIRGKARGNHCRVSNIFFKLSCRLVGIFQDGHFKPNVRK